MENKQGSQMRITDSEIELLKSVFRDNEPLVRLLRKLFLPELDPTVPIGQNIDLWMTVKIDDLTPEQALINLKARNTLISHLETVLMTIKTLSNPVEKDAESLKRNSTK